MQIDVEEIVAAVVELPSVCLILCIFKICNRWMVGRCTYYQEVHFPTNLAAALLHEGYFLIPLTIQISFFPTWASLGLLWMLSLVAACIVTFNFETFDQPSSVSVRLSWVWLLLSSVQLWEWSLDRQLHSFSGKFSFESFTGKFSLESLSFQNPCLRREIIYADQLPAITVTVTV